MALQSWITDTGEKIQDQNAEDIVFKKTAAQINYGFTVSPQMTLKKPMGNVSINYEFGISAFMILRKFMSSRILYQWIINTAANSRVSEWTTIMIKYIGDRSVGT